PTCRASRATSRAGAGKSRFLRLVRLTPQEPRASIRGFFGARPRRRCARGDRREGDARQVRGIHMGDARRMGKSELFSRFAEKFEIKRTQAREYFDELTALAETELKRSGEFVLPGMVKLVVQKRK